MWLRAYDQAKSPQSFEVIAPEGDILDLKRNKDGVTPGRLGWGSLKEIAKGINVIEDQSIKNISAQMGDMHKVRNFYNNLINPNSDAGDVTMDTHAIAAALLRALAGESKPVKQNFGAGGGSGVTGAKGSYGIYADAYREAAKQRGLLPREMQSITWEAVRGLFTDTFKANGANVDAIDAVWNARKAGEIGIDEARQRILSLAGGIDAPDWAPHAVNVTGL